jgi:DNA-directed RNA polymerase beta' subunit
MSRVESTKRKPTKGNSGFSRRTITEFKPVGDNGSNAHRGLLDRIQMGRINRKQGLVQTSRIKVQPGGSQQVNSSFITRRFLANIDDLPEQSPDQFYIESLDDDKIKKLSGSIVISSSNTNLDVHNGINSLAMGYHGTGSYVCSSCNVSGNCYGHMGRLEMALPVPNPAHMDKIITVVQFTCHTCGNIPVDISILMSINQVNGKGLLALLREVCIKELNACVHCHSPPYNIEVQKKHSVKFNQIIYSKIKTSDQAKREKEERAKKKKENKEKIDAGEEVAAPVKTTVKKQLFLMRHDTLLSILKRVTPQAARILGITINPVNMMMNYIPVLPPIIRPGIEIENNIKHHALTISYKLVIDKNNALLENVNKLSVSRKDKILAYSELATAVNFLIMGGKAATNQSKIEVDIEEFVGMDHKVPAEILNKEYLRSLDNDGIRPHNGKIEVKSITPSGNIINTKVEINVVTAKPRGGGNRVDPNSSINGILKTKHGEIIGRILAKRCTGGKAVLSIGHYLEYGEIGLPKAMADEFSIPMTVTSENYYLIQDMRKPTDKYPRGMIKKIKKKGMNVMVSLYKQSIEVGDEIERVLMEGDTVIFNRFPIIWRHSMSAYTVKIHDGITIDLHQSALEKHNADFDGDSGVIHVPYTESARRAAVLMHVRRNFTSASSGASVAGLIMDASLAGYYMTDNVREMSEEQFRRHLLAVRKEDEVDIIMDDIKRRVEKINSNVIGLNVKTWTTATLYSTSLPAGFNYQHDGAIIINGIVVYGTLHKPHLGTGQHSITRYLVASMGDNAAADYLTYSNWIAVEWLNYHGLSIGMDDVLIQDEEFNKEVQRIVDDNVKRYYITSLRGRTTKENPNDTERKAWSVLESTQGMIADLFMNYCEKNKTNGIVNNGLYHLIKSGKISKEIASQMIGSVGVVSYFGQFCPESEGRCTIYGLKREAHQIRDPRELGYIKSSYSQGVTPLEAFIGFRSAMGGAVSTNCATADFGHIYNLLNAVLTSCYITKGMVIQYMGSIPKMIMAHPDVRGIDTEKAMTNSRKEFGLGNLQNIADSINLRM